MAKITLTDLTSNYATTTQLNNNFNSIDSEFQNKVLYRNNPAGEPNQMENELDMNSNRIINVGAPVNDNDGVRLKDLSPSGNTTTASTSTVTDSSGYYSSANVEGALKEIGDGKIVDQWMDKQSASYVSGTQFTVDSDLTSNFRDWSVGDRIKVNGSSTGTIYGTITEIDYNITNANKTTIIAVWDSGSLSNETLTVQVGILSAGTGSASPIHTFVLTPERFGAIGDGVTDDTTAIDNWWTFCRTNGFTPHVGSREKVWKFTSPLTSTATQDIHLEGDGGTLYGTTGCLDIGDYNNGAPERRIRFRSRGVSYKTDTTAGTETCVRLKEFVADFRFEDAVFGQSAFHVKLEDALIGQFYGCVFRDSTDTSVKGSSPNGYAAPNLVIFDGSSARKNAKVHDFNTGAVLLRDWDCEDNDAGAGNAICKYINMGGGGSGTALMLEGLCWFEGNTGGYDLYFRGVNNQRQVILNGPKFISGVTTHVDVDDATIIWVGGSANASAATNHLILGSNTRGFIFGTSFDVNKITDNSSDAVTIITPDFSGKTMVQTDLTFKENQGVQFDIPSYSGFNRIYGGSSATTIFDNASATLGWMFQVNGTNKFRITDSGAIGVGNTLVASSLGSVQRKMEVFNESGVSLGFVPIYDSIS